MDLSSVYITSGYRGTSVEGSVLRCSDHKDWEVDVDGTPIDTAIQRATDHVKEQHQ